MHDGLGLNTAGRLLTVVFAMHILAVSAISLNSHHHHPIHSREYVQLGSENQFLGTFLWDTVDVLTFGALEKKHNRTKNGTIIEGAHGPIN